MHELHPPFLFYKEAEMGSTIGDYIHYRWQNYERLGIKRYSTQGGSAVYDFATQKNRIKQKWSGKSKMSDADKATLRQNLAYIFNSNAVDNTNIAQIQNEIAQQLSVKFNEAMGNINWDTGDVVSITDAEASGLKNSAVSYIRTEKSQKSIYISTIWSRIQGLETVISGITSETTKSKLTAQINQVKQELSAITGLSEEYLQRCGLSLGQKKTGSSSNSISLSDAQSLVSELNGIIRKTKSAIPAQKGALFEYAAALSKLVGQEIGQEEIKKALESVVGGNSSSTVVVKDNFTKSINWDSLGLQEQLDDYGNSVIVTGNSQQKVDVTYQLSDGGEAGISAKSINPYNGRDISIVSGSPQLYLIGDVDSSFVNHYLNVTATHRDGRPDGSLLTAAHEAMKVTLFYKALSGDTQNREAADILLINNNKASGADSIRIYDINDLVSKAAENINAYAQITANGADINSLSFDNTWGISGWPERVTRIIQQLHAQKISAALKTSAIMA